MNGSSYRYALSALMLMAVAAGTLLARAADRLPYEWRVVPGAALIVVMVAAFSGPAVAAGRLGRAPVAALECKGCTHLRGEYWLVWPSVVSFLEHRYETGDPRPAWGLTTRGEEANRVWSALPAAQRVDFELRVRTTATGAQIEVLGGDVDAGGQKEDLPNLR
jgi:hypothetical protein